MIKPQYGRKLTMDIVDSYLKTINNPIILEVGMTRIRNNWLDDGYSTIFFSWLVNQYHGNLYSVDIDPNAISLCENILREHNLLNDNIHLINDDALNYFESFNYDIDVLFLDGWDYTVTDPAAKTIIDLGINKISEDAHLKCLQLVEHRLKSGSIIIIDDILDNQTYFGKGKTVIPYMLDNGYELHPISMIADPEVIMRKIYQFLFIKR